jgi:hypothetical protein
MHFVAKVFVSSAVFLLLAIVLILSGNSNNLASTLSTILGVVTGMGILTVSTAAYSKAKDNNDKLEGFSPADIEHKCIPIKQNNKQKTEQMTN